MKLCLQVSLLLSVIVEGFSFSIANRRLGRWNTRAKHTSLAVSIGLGPEQKEEGKQELVAGVDYEVPDHEAFRTSRRSKMDEKADQWFASLLDGNDGVLGQIAQQARSKLTTPVELKNDVGFQEVHHHLVLLSNSLTHTLFFTGTKAS